MPDSLIPLIIRHTELLRQNSKFHQGRLNLMTIHNSTNIQILIICTNTSHAWKIQLWSSGTCFVLNKEEKSWWGKTAYGWLGTFYLDLKMLKYFCYFHFCLYCLSLLPPLRKREPSKNTSIISGSQDNI